MKRSGTFVRRVVRGGVRTTERGRYECDQQDEYEAIELGDAAERAESPDWGKVIAGALGVIVIVVVLVFLWKMLGDDHQTMVAQPSTNTVAAPAPMQFAPLEFAGPLPVQVVMTVDGQPGRDGRDGRDGADGKPGPDGKSGRNGHPGANGQDGIQRIELVRPAPEPAPAPPVVEPAPEPAPAATDSTAAAPPPPPAASKEKRTCEAGWWLVGMNGGVPVCFREKRNAQAYACSQSGATGDIAQWDGNTVPRYHKVNCLDGWSNNSMPKGTGPGSPSPSGR